MEQKRCDLHTHSYYSDGTDSPQEIVDKALELGLTAVALCDHNTTRGLGEFISYARDKAVDAVAGVEFSTDHNGKELHILALFVPENAFDKVQAYVNKMHISKEQSNIRLISSLKKAGYDLDYDRIFAEANGNINRAHVASELTQKGYTSSVKEAFDTVLSVEQGYYVPPERLDALETVEFIKSIGAVGVLAHPYLNLSAEELEIFLPLAVQHGLDGMETRYSAYSPETEALALQTAQRYRLLQSGGSDYHGERKQERLGIGRGDLTVPSEYYYGLRSRSKGV